MVRYSIFLEKRGSESHVFPKRMSGSALPEAHRAGCPGRRLVWNRPRNSCCLHDLRGHEPGGKSRLRQGGRLPIFFKKIHEVNFFEKEEKKYHTAF
jgi:hypothetical protein